MASLRRLLSASSAGLRRRLAAGRHAGRASSSQAIASLLSPARLSSLGGLGIVLYLFGPDSANAEAAVANPGTTSANTDKDGNLFSDDNGNAGNVLLDDLEDIKKGGDGDQEKDEFGNALPKSNPGRLEGVGREAKEVLNPDIIDGVRVNMQMPLGPQSQEKMLMLQHMFWMGTSFFGPEKGFYECMTILQSGTFVMTGALDSMWRLQGRTITMFRPGVLGKMQFQMCPDGKMPDSIMCKLDYAGQDFSAALEFQNLFSVLATSYFQKITKNVSVGVQYQLVPNLMQPDFSVCCLAGVFKFKKNGHVVTARVEQGANQIMGNVNYARKVDKNFSVATEAVLSPQKMHASVGLKYDFHNDSKGRYCAVLDSDLTTSVTYSEELIQGIRLGYCGQIAHLKNDYLFGMQLMMGEG